LVKFSFNEEHDDHTIENIDDILHIRNHKWDISCFHFDGDPIYDIDNDSSIKIAELFPFGTTIIFQKIFIITFSHIFGNMADFWQHEEDIFIDLFQPYRDDLLHPSHGN
jgi:hypothetical protein